MTTPVPVLESIDPRRFRDDVVAAGQPVVLRGVLADWPLLARARAGDEALADYLADGAAEHPVNAFVAPAAVGGRYFYNDDLSGFNFERCGLPLGDLLQRILALREQPEPEGVYAGAIPLTGPLQSLADANPMPLLDEAGERLVSLWLGNRGQTATHWDLPQNLACVVHGRRRFTLFPPEQLANLYVGPVDRTLAGQPVSLVDVLAPDLERFPRYAEAQRHARVAELEPGDTLYIPSMWFHHVEARDRVGVLVNFWWRDGPAYLATPLLTLMHALLTLRELPAREREIWRAMFDHYIFAADADTLAHIPEHARGFLGEMTPERLGRLRAMLLHSLGGEPRRR